MKRQEERRGEVVLEIKGKVGGSVKSCESACHRGSIWGRPRGKHRANCHSSRKHEEHPTPDSIRCRFG